MKKMIACLLIAALAISLSGCGLIGLFDQIKDPVSAPTFWDYSTDETTDVSTEYTQPAEPDAAVYDNRLIGEAYAAEGTYTDEFDNTYNYSYHLPILLDSGDAATQINTAINTRFGTIISECLNEMQNGYSMGYYHVAWDAYWHGSVLFLVITCDSDWGFTDYGVYCYDFAAQAQRSGSEILAMAGYTDEEFLSAMLKAADDAYVNQYKDIPAEYKDAFYENQRAWTISDENINLDLQMFIDDAGRLVVVTPIGSIAGANWYYQILYPFVSN